MYEQAVLIALTTTRTNNRRFPLRELRQLILEADRERLLAAGDPLPGAGPFMLYRGVAGRGPARRVRGVSWTASKEQARWFAERGASWGLDDPAVFWVQAGADDVMAYTNHRQEEEFIVLLPYSAMPARA